MEDQRIEVLRQEIERLIRNWIDGNYEKISTESDRGAILVASSLLEQSLESIIKDKLIGPVEGVEKDPLFKGANPPLGTFSAKIEVAYRLKLIDEDQKKTLNTFRSLRNKFAHTVSVSKLLDPSVKDQLIAAIEHSPDLIKELSENGHRLNQNVSENLRKMDPRILFDVAFSILIVQLHHKR